MKHDGYKSRKLWLTVGTMACEMWAFKMAGAPKELFGQLCMALLTTAGIFHGSSVYEKIKGVFGPAVPPPPAP